MPYVFSPAALSEVMEKRGLKDADLAEALSMILRSRVTPQSVNQWRNGIHVPHADKLVNMARYLGVKDLMYFFENGDLAS